MGGEQSWAEGRGADKHGRAIGEVGGAERFIIECECEGEGEADNEGHTGT